LQFALLALMKYRVMLRFLLLLFCFLFARIGITQHTLPEFEIKLQGIAEEIMLSDDEQTRKTAFEKFLPVLSEAVKLPGSFLYPFDSLKRVSIVYAQDSSFRLFSGQLYLNEDLYKYYGAIQTRSNEKELIVLADRSEGMRFIENERLDTDNWYGVVYYNIYDFDTPTGRKYLLFGFDNYRLFENRKIIDVLSFEGKKVTFGAPVIENNNREWIMRMILQYSSDVGVRLNYDADHQMIIYDNLIPMKSPYTDRSIAMVPDGSYRGLTLQEGKWHYIDKVFFQTLIEPPRENPVLSGGKDLFGRKKN
jgi:hypothetical protein